jgi:BMFP domain-containing protein YqiC
MAIVELAPDYTNDDLASDLQNLSELVDTVVSSLMEIDHGNLDCVERNKLNRVGSLAWITRDQLELIQSRVSPKDHAGTAKRARASAEV